MRDAQRTIGHNISCTISQIVHSNSRSQKDLGISVGRSSRRRRVIHFKLSLGLPDPYQNTYSDGPRNRGTLTNVLVFLLCVAADKRTYDGAQCEEKS